jgi:hypothetical protein
MPANYGFEQDVDTNRVEQVIINDPWFVNLSLSEFVEQFGIPATLENNMLIEKLICSIDEVNQKLVRYVEQQKKNGYANLESVPATKINNINPKVMQYKRAVYSLAKSELIKSNISMVLKNDAANHAESSDALAAHYQKQSTNGLARIMGRGAIGVHSI